MKFKVVCYNTILHRNVKVSKTKSFNKALQLFMEECEEEELFIDVRLYKGFIKITSCFMGDDHYKELKNLLNNNIQSVKEQYVQTPKVVE